MPDELIFYEHFPWLHSGRCSNSIGLLVCQPWPVVRKFFTIYCPTFSPMVFILAFLCLHPYILFYHSRCRRKGFASLTRILPLFVDVQIQLVVRCGFLTVIKISSLLLGISTPGSRFCSNF